MKLIDADALKMALIDILESIKRNPKMDGQEMHIIAACHMLGEMIDDETTYAYRERSGKWSYFPSVQSGVLGKWKCSECGHFVENGSDRNYCPHCGAKMDLEDNDEVNNL